MPKRIFIKDGGLTSSIPTPTGYTVIGADGGTPKKQIISTISDLGGFTHYIGEYFEGGVIFSLWKENGIEKGLIVDTVNVSTGTSWSNVTGSASSATSSWDGLSNSNAIISQSGHVTSAAKLCLDSTNGGYTDWYLPAIDELHLMRINRFYINQTLNNIVGSTPLPRGDESNYYLWSSTEFSGQPTFAWYVDSYDGDTYDLSKSQSFNTVVRAVRRF